MTNLGKIADITGGHLKGAPDVTITGVAPMETAQVGEITFLSASKYAKHLRTSTASAFIVGRDLDPALYQERNVILVDNPLLAFAKTVTLFATPSRTVSGVHPTAFVSEEAVIEPSASVGALSHIGVHTIIGENVVIHPLVFIGDNVRIGKNTIVYPNATLCDGVQLGQGVIVNSGSVIGGDGFGYVWDGEKHFKIPQIGTVVIEDDVEIGANATIDRASLGITLIKKGAKIDNLVQVAHNVTIGEHSIIVAQVGIAGSAKIGSHVILAGQAGVRDHVTVGNNVQAGGRTGITKSVPDNMRIMGTPHLDLREWAELQAYLKRLPKLFKKMKDLEQRMVAEDTHD